MPGGPERLIRLRLLFLACALCAGLPVWADPDLRLTSETSWSLDSAWFGGFSGIDVTDHGTHATLITDKARLLQVSLHRKDGRLAHIDILRNRPMRHRNGRRLTGLSHDAEGLAVSGDGTTAFVSFEHRHRVAAVDLASGHTTLLPSAAAFAQFLPNAGLEALALHPDGSLYALPEMPAGGATSFDLYRFRDAHWQVAGRLPRRGPFLPVGADVDDQGMIYLLERAVTPLGFRSRIRRFDPTNISGSETILLNTLPGRFDNLEGLSVWQDASGATHLTLISDDNFLSLQQTQIVEYRLLE